MSKIKDASKKITTAINDELKKQKEFFKKPDVLISLSIAAIVILNKYLKEPKSKKLIQDFLKKDNASRAILAQTSADITEDNLNELLLECLNEGGNNLQINIEADILAEDFLNIANTQNDIDKKTKNEKIKDLANKIGYSTEMIVSYTFLLYYIINATKELFTNFEHPPKYRVKYIQKLLRYVYGIINYQLGAIIAQSNQESIMLNAAPNIIIRESINSFKEIVNTLKQIDNILIAIALATTIYINNRRTLQKRSLNALSDISKDIACVDIGAIPNVSIKPSKFNLTLNCPIIIDDEIVSHIPIEDKLNALSCEIIDNEEAQISSEPFLDLTTIAIIKNNRKQEKLIPNIIVGTFVNQSKVIATIGNTPIFSPVIGYVDDVLNDQIIIKDIVDPEKNFLSTQIELLSKKYERLNSIKPFIRTYYIESIYPHMLSLSLNYNSFSPNIQIGIEDQWKRAKTVNVSINKLYERNIKNITNKETVEKHAKNETLDEISKKIKRETNLLFLRLSLLGENTENISKQTLAKPKEYELFEYYVLNLGNKLNSLESPSLIEVEFKDVINEFIRKRFISDAYNKYLLQDKINEKIRQIKNTPNYNNYFKAALDIYNSSKNINDVKKWLQGFANNNNKLKDNEKVEVVNAILFIFKICLEYEQLNEKYNILKKETTPIKETIKEGNQISLFFKNLRKEQITLENDIAQIQNTIESLSQLQTYSIITYNDKVARLYTFPDILKCVPGDDDFKPSKYSYGDMEYWRKYCAYATLASVTNPITGWSTGWIVPSPILLPVVYIPSIAITTKYGVIVIGLSICGIWIYPWVMFVNLSYNYVIPLGDPTGTLKHEIQTLKKTISEELSNLQKISIKKLRDNVKKEIDEKEKEIKITENDIKLHKDKEPKKINSSTENEKLFKSIKRNINYAQEYKEWLEIQLSLKGELVVQNRYKWKLTQKWKLLNEGVKLGKSIKGAEVKLEKTEKFINKQLDKLDKSIDDLEKFIATLPISIKPNSANFGITLKATKPINKIAENFDENVNNTVLDEIKEKFNLKTRDMMSSKYGEKISKSILSTKQFKDTLIALKYVLIIKDPFPKYENLNISNIPWMAFLYLDFTKVGAQLYGFPGFPPFYLP